MKKNRLTREEEKVIKKLKNTLKEFLGDSLVGMKLYGSRAKGDFDSDSDIDIAIIVRGLTRDVKNHIFKKVSEIEVEHLLPLSTLILSEDEFNHLKRRERRIVLDIENEGITL